MTTWPKNASSPSIFTFRSMAALIDSSRPDWTLITYHFLADVGSAGAPFPAAGSRSPSSSPPGPAETSTGGSSGGGESTGPLSGIVSSSGMVRSPRNVLPLGFRAGRVLRRLVRLRRQYADPGVTQRPTPEQVDGQQKPGQQGGEDEDDDRVLHQFSPRRPGDLVHLRL